MKNKNASVGLGVLQLWNVCNKKKKPSILQLKRNIFKSQYLMLSKIDIYLYRHVLGIIGQSSMYILFLPFIQLLMSLGQTLVLYIVCGVIDLS